MVYARYICVKTYRGRKQDNVKRQIHKNSASELLLILLIFIDFLAQLLYIMFMPHIKSKITALRTVYPPISNFDAVRLQEDSEVEAILRTSDFYMIGARAQARLENPKLESDGTFTFDFCVGEQAPAPFRINLLELPGVVALGEEDTFELEFDVQGRGFRIWDGTAHKEGVNVIEWFTTEKLLWDAARARPGIVAPDNLRELATYDLLYVGIAKKGDSFDRLLAKGHKARMDILAKEPQRYPGARVSDETFLFMFTIDPLIFQTFDPNEKITDSDMLSGYDHKSIVCDAEKAFVSLLKPEYNVQRFANYPKGSDGLYGADFDRYGYVLAEEMAFNTAHGRIQGGMSSDGMFTNGADAIFVDGDSVTFYQSGVDFPA